jgi:hypothetical protein
MQQHWQASPTNLGFAVLSVVFPAWVTYRVHNYKYAVGGLAEDHVLMKYGNFYTGNHCRAVPCGSSCFRVKPDADHSVWIVSRPADVWSDYKLEGWRVYFFFVQLWFENQAFAFIAVPSHFPLHSQQLKAMQACSGVHGESRGLDSEYHDRVIHPVLHHSVASTATVCQSQNHGSTTLAPSQW